MRDLQIEYATRALLDAMKVRNAALRVPYDLDSSPLYFQWHNSTHYYSRSNVFHTTLVLLLPNAIDNREARCVLRQFTGVLSLSLQEQNAFLSRSYSSLLRRQLKEYKALLLEQSEVGDIMAALNLL